jgi:uncharacterized membrane protein YeiB
MPTTTHPVPVFKRSEISDILRGFALLGICLANYLYWHYAFFKVLKGAIFHNPCSNADKTVS